jgi:hypothetical protein
VIKIDLLLNKRVIGGFVIKEIVLSREPLEDALGREALAQTRIVGREFAIIIRASLPEEEISITLYHETLEAATMASAHPPTDVCELNEAGFEAAAHRAHRIWGTASVENLNRMLQFYGFQEALGVMADHEKIQFDLVKLLGGERILRFTDPQSGLSLEKKLHPGEAVARQKFRLLEVFDAALERAEKVGA